MAKNVMLFKTKKLIINRYLKCKKQKMDKATEEYIETLNVINMHSFKILDTNILELTHNFYHKNYYDNLKKTTNNLTSTIIKLVKEYNFRILLISECETCQIHTLHFNKSISKEHIEELTTNKTIDDNLYSLPTEILNNIKIPNDTNYLTINNNTRISDVNDIFNKIKYNSKKIVYLKQFGTKIQNIIIYTCIGINIFVLTIPIILKINQYFF